MNFTKLRGAIVLLAVLTGCSEALAVSAYPYGVTVDTPTGKTITIFMRGDEHQRYAVTNDGYTILSDAEGWWYAVESDEGHAVKSPYRLMADDDETETLRQFKLTCKKGIVPRRTSYDHAVFSPGLRASQATGPVTGQRRALVVLMQFADLRFRKTREDFMSLFNGVGYSENGAVGSVRDYYRWASQGQLDYVSDVYGPYTSTNKMSYYGDEDHTVDLCVEAIRNLPDTIDYSQYDNDGDGTVDNIHIVFAGYGEEAGASSDAIWSHEYPHRIGMKSEVGYSFAGYSCTPELRENRGSNISYIGVICHELGHALGAMDYYDVNYKTGGQYIGTGQWDIMADGSWNDHGRTPSNFNPYVRSVIFGWNPQVMLKDNQQVVMPKMESDNADRSAVYRINTGNTDDYFLLENRQQEGFDEALPGAGLIVYHVHPYFERYRLTNTVNATHPQGFYPVCAAQSLPRQQIYGDINSAACPFPGTHRVRTFSATSSPAAVAWNNSAATVAVSNITTLSDGSITFTTGNAISEPDEPEEPVQTELFYGESFEKSVEERLSVVSVMGKTTWQTFRQGSLVANGEYIPEATDGKGVLMLYSPKNSSVSESEAVSSYISVIPLQEYILSFDVYALTLAGPQPPQLHVYVEDSRESKVFSLADATTGWNHVELPLRFASDKFRYKFYGIINAGGIFIDNVCIYQQIPTIVKTKDGAKGLDIKVEDGVIRSSTANVGFRLYDMSGATVYKSVKGVTDGVGIRVPSGVYVVAADDGRRKKLVVR